MKWGFVMNEYKRFVSYIYAYPGGVKEKNVGFSKVEVRQGQFKLGVTLRGVYTDTPEIFTVYMLVNRNEKEPGKYTLVPLGNCMVKNGMAQYNDIFNAANINMTGYEFSDICGIAVANVNNRYYMMFTMWEDYDVNPSLVEITDKNYRKPEKEETPVAETEVHEEESSIEETSAKEEEPTVEETSVQGGEPTVVETAGHEDAKDVSVVEDVKATENAKQYLEPDLEPDLEPEELTGVERLFTKCDSIDAFPDDVYYDCIEVSPEMLKNVLLPDEISPNNSFLLHGYYNFRHLLFGRVQENANNTKYFIGVPGMYCNRERYMASIFGFRNFKKSHRADFMNPYFGYWIMEI